MMGKKQKQKNLRTGGNSNILHANYHHVTPFKSNTIRDFLSNKWQVMKNFLKIQLIHELYQLKWKSHATTINSRNKKKQQISRSRKLQTYKMSSVKYLNILCQPEANIQKQPIPRCIFFISCMQALSNKFLSRTFSQHNHHMSIFFEPLFNKFEQPTSALQIEWGLWY